MWVKERTVRMGKLTTNLGDSEEADEEVASETVVEHLRDDEDVAVLVCTGVFCAL